MDKEYMEKAYEQAEKSSCTRAKVGAIFIKDNNIIAQGYNHVTGGIKDCKEIGCIRDILNIPSGEKREVCRGICAEQLAITEAARNGVSLDGSIIYVTTFPCYICSKMLASAGIREIIYDSNYPDERSKEFLMEAGIKYRKI